MGIVLKTFRVSWLGRVEYTKAQELQHRVWENILYSDADDTMLMMEHPSVFTLGRRGQSSDILLPQSALDKMNISPIHTDRGGEVTYHGPGQLIGYPIVNLREAGLGPVSWARLIEEAIISVLAEYGMKGHRVVGKTGVFIGGEPGSKVTKDTAPKGRKIAALGMRITEGIVTHGFALNISTDLSMFKYIVPCGMKNLKITSILEETGINTSVEEVGWLIASVLSDILGRNKQDIPSDAIYF